VATFSKYPKISNPYLGFLELPWDLMKNASQMKKTSMMILSASFFFTIKSPVRSITLPHTSGTRVSYHEENISCR
jgi:hypothetical protein